MRASIDSTIMEIEGLTEERIKLRKLITETVDNNNEGNNLLFKPFLLGTPLYAIYQSLVNAQNEVNKNRRSVLEHLVEIIAMQNELSGYLSDIHRELVKVIIDSEFILIQLIINNLSGSHDPISDIWQDYNIAEEITRALITEENQQDITVITLVDSFKELLNKMNEQALKIEFDEIVTSCGILTLSPEENYKKFQETAQPLVKKLGELLQQTKQQSFENLTTKINELLEKIEEVGQAYIKQDVVNQIDLINNDPWAKITEKKKLFCDLIPLIEILCYKAPTLKLTEHEQDTFCKQISAGFELTRESSFLALMEGLATLFYSNNFIRLQNISDYIQSARDTIVTTNTVIKPVLKRVHFSNENQVKLIEARPGIQAQYRNEPASKRQCTILTNQTFSANTEKFINILDPVVSDTKDISRRFVAAVLIHIVASVDSLKTEKGPFKLLMKHYILTQALEICPENAIDLHQELEEKINILCSTKGSKTAINDHQKYASQNNSVDTESGPQKPPVITRFKAILSRLVKDIDACTPASMSFDKQMQCFIDCLFIKINEDKKQRINQKVLQIIQAPFLASNADSITMSVEAPVQKTVKSQSRKQDAPTLTSQQVQFKTLSKAMFNANEDDFKTYLVDIKNTMTSSQYLEFLIEKNHAKFNPLHTVLHSEGFSNFGNIPIYLSEVKAMMFAEEKYSFQQFLVSTTTTGLTFLHLVAKIGSLGFLKDTISDIKCELSSGEYARALRMVTNFGYFPSCPPEKDNNYNINQYLKLERFQNPVTTDTRNNLFHDNSDRTASSKDTHLSVHPGK